MIREALIHPSLRRLQSIVILLTALSPLTAFAAGTTASNFLKIAPGARAAGVGEAYTALADDASSIYWNAAGLSSVHSQELLISHNIWFQDMQHSFIAVAMPVGRVSSDLMPVPAIGFSATYFGVDGMERRSANTAASQGSFSAGDLAVAVAYSRPVRLIPSLPFAAGMTFKYISQSIDQYSATAVAADFGLKVPVSIGHFPLTFGAAVQNIGTEMKFIDESYPLPVVWKAGLSVAPFGYGWLPLGLTGDISFPNDGDMSWRVGTEYFMGDILTLRLGYANQNSMTREALSGTTQGAPATNSLASLTGMMAGFGTRIPLSRVMGAGGSISIDYAFVPYGELGNTHRISLGMKW